MNRLEKGYNRLSVGYDLLARVMIGKSVQESQRFGLPLLKDRRKVLILGGGTGWILPDIAKINSTLQIDYVDVSANMIHRTQSRLNNLPLSVRCICGTESSIPDADYDCVITGFYLDHFNDSQLPEVIRHIQGKLNGGAYWLATDFCVNNFWQHQYIRSLYLIFGWLTGIDAKQLPAWQQALVMAGGKLQVTKTWKRNWIQTSVYQF